MSAEKNDTNKWSIYIGYLILFLIVCALSYHMYSYFFRLTFVNTSAVDEFASIMAMYRRERMSADILFYWPAIFMIWCGHFWIETAKLYKLYILFAVVVNYLQACIFYKVVCEVEQNRLSARWKIVISTMAYAGTPTYCLLYGGYIKSTLLVCVFWCVLLYVSRNGIWDKIRKQIYFEDSKIPGMIALGIYVVVVFSGVLTENSYMIPFWIILLLDGFIWKTADSGILLINTISAFLFMVCMRFEACRMLRMCFLMIFFETCWLLIPQAFRTARKHRYHLEICIYMIFLCGLLIMQCLGIAGRVKNVKDDFADDMMGADQYYDIYGQNLELIRMDYTDESNEVFYGTTEFIELCGQLIQYTSEGRTLVLADELTGDKLKWAGAITGADTISVNGLEVLNEELSDIVQQYDYIMLFSDSRVYMAHYEYIANYMCVYNNSEGRMIQNSGNL